jgi:hypothetical protein
MRRIMLAFRCFFRVLFGKPIPAELLPPAPPAAALPPAAVAAPARPATPPRLKTGPESALVLLGMFQREGRLVDFLRESIDGFDDAAVGAAVRDIHRGLRRVLDEHFTVEPVVSGEENDTITVDAEDFDPRSIRLVGNVNGKPPFKGVLRHHGWRAAQVKMPEITESLDPSVVAPAELEIA